MYHFFPANYEFKKEPKLYNVEAEIISDEEIQSCFEEAKSKSSEMMKDLNVSLFEESFTADLDLKPREVDDEVETDKYNQDDYTNGNDQESVNYDKDSITTSLDVIFHFFSKSQLTKLPLTTSKNI